MLVFMDCLIFFFFFLVAIFFNYLLNSLQFPPNWKPNRYNPLDMKCVFSTATLWELIFISSVFGVYYFDYYLGFEWNARFVCSVLDQRIILINSDRVLMHLVNLWECDEMVKCVSGRLKMFHVAFSFFFRVVYRYILYQSTAYQFNLTQIGFSFSLHS